MKTCYVCGDTIHGEVVDVTPTKSRHPQHYPGSARWVEYYKKLPRRLRTEAGDTLYKCARARVAS